MPFSKCSCTTKQIGKSQKRLEKKDKVKPYDKPLCACTVDADEKNKKKNKASLHYFLLVLAQKKS